MKALATYLALGCMAASSASAGYSSGYEQNRWPHWYVGLQGSVSFLNETDVTLGSTRAGDLDFESGYGLGASLGYTPKTNNAFFNQTRFELEYYYRTNDLDELSAGGASSQIADDISSNSYMFNAYYDFNTGTSLSPYLGGGVGITNIELNVPSLAVSDEDSVFAYQLMAGVGWQPESLLNTVLHVGYRYFDASDPDFSAIGGARLDHEYEGHNIEAGARFRF